MSQVKKTKEKVKFSKLRLRSASNKSKTLNSPRPSEKISSYFSSVLNETNSHSQLENYIQNTECQKNNNLPNVSRSDTEDDFKETKTQKPAKMFQIKSHKEVKNTKKRARSKKAISTFGKNVIVEPGCSDTNQEHLQLAMAMSKSLDEIENPNRNTVDSIESNNSFPSTQEKIAKIKSTLDQFGFKSNKSITDLPTRQKSIRKKFKYITPTLYLRTDEDRTKIIENKVSEIIENIAVYNKNISKTCAEDEIETEINSNKPKSFMLRDFYNEDAVLFRKNGVSCSEMSQKLFYNGTVTPTDVKVDVLLKDWNSIPGREKTPPLPDTKENMNSKITESNRSLNPELNSETLLSENINYHKSNSPTRIRSIKSSALHIEMPNMHLNNRSPSPEFKNISEFIEHTSSIHQLHVTSPINRSISPDLFSDSDLDTEILLNKKNNSPPISNKKNTLSPCQIISSNDSSNFSCDTVLLSNKTNLSQPFTKNKNLSPFPENSSNESSNFSIETKILSPKKQSAKTISPLFNKKNNICSALHEISSTDSSDFSRDTKLLSPEKINKNNISPVVNKAENILNADEENSNGHSSHFSCDTVILYENKNCSSPLQDNNSNTSTFSCETKHLSDQSDANSVSLLEISPHKNKIKKSPKSPSSCKKNLFESISLLDISPHKNKTKKSSNLERKSIFDDITPVKCCTNIDDLPGNSKNKNCKMSPTLEKSRNDVSEEDKNILHFESFCDDSNNCFDLTQSSNDSTDVRFNKSVEKLIQNNEQASHRILFVPETSDILNTAHQDKCKLSNNSLNCSVNNDELMTVSQLLNTSLLENNKHNNNVDAIDLTQSPSEEIEIKKINDTDKIVSKLELQNNTIKRKKSDEAEIENNVYDKNVISPSDTKDSSIRKSFQENDRKNTEFIAPIISSGEFCYNKLYDEDINIISFFGHANRNEISRHRSFEYKNADTSDNNMNQNLDYNSSKSSKRNNSILDQSNKSKRTSLRRSFSEKIIRNKEFNYISPKSSKDSSFLKLISPTEKLFQSQTCRQNNSSRLVNKFGDKNELSSKEIKPKCLNESFENMEMSDDELNYSCNKRNLNKCNKSFVRSESEKDHEILSHSGDNTEISDEELNYSCNKIENNKSKYSPKIDNQEKQNEEEYEDNVQFLSQSSVDELDEIEHFNRNSQLLIASPPSEKEEENADDVQFLSQSSIEACSDISDEELNYSCNTPYKRKVVNKKLNETKDKYVREEENDVGNVIDRSLNIEANVIDFNDLPCNEYQHSDSLFGSYYNELNSTPMPTRKTPSINGTQCSEVLKHPRVANLCTPISNKFRNSCSQLDDTFDNIVKEKGIFDKIADINRHENSIVKTPENAKSRDEQIITPNSAIIIKTSNVTPMPQYNDMDTPQRNKELEKFGLKPMKRAKGVKILQYIYDATHPITGAEKIHKSSSEDEDNRIIKRRKKNTMDENTEAGSSKNNKCIKRKSFNNEIFAEDKIDGKIEILGNKIAESESEKDMIFERTFSSRIASCRLPLHIAWHNFVSSQPDLHEKILLYEPLQIEDIYAKFKSFGLKYHVQDLIAFLDKKCITIRIAQTNRRRKTRKSPKGR